MKYWRIQVSFVDTEEDRVWQSESDITPELLSQAVVEDTELIRYAAEVTYRQVKETLSGV